MIETSATIDAGALAGIVATVAALCRSSATGVSVTLTVPGARAYDPATGTADYASTTTTVTAWVSDVSLMRSAPSEAQAGDVTVLVAYGDLDAQPATGGRFTVASGDRAGTSAIYKSGSGPLDTHYQIYGHKAD